MSLPASYAKLLELSQQMREFAVGQDWEALTRCEAERAGLIAAMPSRPAVFSASEAKAVANCLRQVQNCDRQILDYVMPWREQVATLLSRLSTSSQPRGPMQTELAALTPDSRTP